MSPGGTLPASLATSAIALRPATPADAGFCCRLHKAATGDCITAAWGWDEQVQRACQDRAVNPHRRQVITAGQASTGMPDTGCRPGEICLPRTGIGPGHQRPGIGSRIIRALLEDAERTGQDLVPGVLTVSRRAQALCRRPGLTEVASDGERGTTVTMRAARHRRQQLARSPRRCEICLCAIAGRLASSAVKAEEPGLPRHDRCSLQPARSPLPEIACPTLKRLRAWLVSGRGSPAATVGGRPGTDAGLSGCRTRRRYSR